jgi:tetratricopeptide (TPR) repeat protein
LIYHVLSYVLSYVLSEERFTAYFSTYLVPHFTAYVQASHDKAIECLLKANACKPNLTTTVELAKVYQTVGQKKEARAALEKALTMDTSLPTYRVSKEEARELLAKM